ncbi:glycosyltransferase family 2 protein [Vibrio wakamikoensis]|uniref:glycosyltransferase family 2 protein n=1 Tax=Vibrio wakamikoensis TaxID=2910251 RepID=UPI003D2241D4
MQVADSTLVNLHVDHLYLSSSMLLLSGWFVAEELTENVRFFHKQDELNQHTLLVPRLDVIAALNVTDEAFCTGFVCIADVSHCDGDIDISINGHLTSLSAFHGSLCDQPELILQATGALRSQFLAQMSQQKIATETEKARSCIDICELVDDNLLLLDGWILDESYVDAFVTNVFGEKQDLALNMIRFERPDVSEELELLDLSQKIGISIASRLTIAAHGLSVELRPRNSQALEVMVKSSDRKLESQPLLKKQLDRTDVYQKDFLNSGCRNISNVVQAIWNSEEKNAGLESVTTMKVYGRDIPEPMVSIIIPIYGRYDFIQHQMLAFSEDVDMHNHEIIYVLDDPKIEREFGIAANGVFQAFKYSFKTVYAGLNLGFSGANNLGASIAKGKYILALNSDVMPTTTGWLSRLVAKYQQTDDCGVLGTRLVYEDDTLQHLGMEYVQDPYYPGIWMNQHPYKGMPSSLFPSQQVRSVESVTGACMLMEKALFDKVNGFDTGYVIGDFEDSDLCLKVSEQDKKIYLDSEEKLVHLERLSQSLVDSGDWKFKLTILNGTRQRNKWDKKILEVKAANA